MIGTDGSTSSPLAQRGFPFGLPLVIVAALFFCSGASALVYQVLWLRTLGWVFGVTVYAASTVWACFMGGLALGSALGGRLADRVRFPLRWFGAAEMLVGATAVATPVAFHALQRAWIALYPTIARAPAALTAGRFTMACLVLIVPTTLMGTTLPLVVKSSAWRSGRFGAHVSFLYASNTAGAIAGTLAAGLYLIPSFGIQRTYLTAAALNILVGLCAILLAPTLALVNAEPSRPALEPPAAPAADHARSAATARLVLVVFGLSGFVSLGLEVVWFRVLTLFLRPTVYSFAVMLATILAGIALGSYLIAWWLDRRAPWVAILALLEIGIGVTTLASFWPLVWIGPFSATLRPALSHVVNDWLAYPVAGSLLSIFPTALLMGIAFPIGLRLWVAAGGGTDIARRTGQFYSLNVAAAIAGSLVGGFVALPFLGSRASLQAFAALSFLSGVALVMASEWSRGARLATGLTASAIFAVIAIRSPQPLDLFVNERYRRERVIWKEEGVESTVVVHKDSRNDLILTLNGNHQADTLPSTVYVHHRIGHLPMALHPDPRTALVIGLGGGATAGAASAWGPSVDVVELSGSVVDGARFFGSINYEVLHRPNVHLRVDDGRNYLMLTPKRYDVITADVILPVYAGAANLYSAEYFQSMRRVLNPGGMVAQWVAGTDAEYKLIARTFLTVFPETTVWGDGTLLIGRTEPLQLRRSDFDRKAQSAAAVQALHDLNTPTFDALLAAFKAGPDELRAFLGAGPILTDDRPLVEYFLSLPREHDIDTSTLKGDVRRYVAQW